jgi:anionic cell wall polymer biosynthesis LytR-Cps2A-Psr (LCP) family protein
MGGTEMVKNTILYNFGLEVDHIVRVNFYGFMGVVDALGGIDVEVGGYLTDKCGRVWSYSPGTYHMDGFQALCYVRMRKTTGDFDRLRREQEVVMALFREVLSINGLSQIPELYEQFNTFVETDMSVEDVFTLLPTAAEVAKDPTMIEHYDIGPEMGNLWRVPYSGASVVLPNWEAIEAMLVESFGLPVQNREG